MLSVGGAAAQESVYDINPGPGSSFLSGFTTFDGAIYFNANDGTNGFELWRTDGTAAGTVQVKDINPGTGSSLPFDFAELNGQLYFSADDGVNGAELWRTDGTAAGTVLVKDVWPGPNSGIPFNFVAFGGALYFTAETEDGFELWKTDGTAAGTVLVKDIWPGPDSSLPSDFAELNGQLYFQANDGTNGFELWQTDGTASGTVLVQDIRPGSAGSAPTDLVAFDGALYFRADDGTNGLELWRTDGTASGTVLIKDIRPGTGSGSPSDLVVFGGALYFQANEGSTGVELWTSDGTAGGTRLLKDIHPASGNAFPTQFAALDGTLYFRADDGANGTELWSTDGTEGGTVLVADVRLGPEGSAPEGLAALGSSLYFGADDGSVGRELWRYAPSQAASCDFTVTTTSDSGAGSLRQAILDGNASAGAETICFDIAGTGPHTIRPATALPQISDPVTIDGLTQPGATCDAWPATLQVELNGSQTSAGTDGLLITAGSSIIRGLVINRFGADAIDLQNGGGNTIACNFLGTDPGGTVDLGNGQDGVDVKSADNVIGDADGVVGNLASGSNNQGIRIAGSAATGNVVRGNRIGTDVTGQAALGNRFSGIIVDGASGNTIGGALVEAGNLISGNGDEGVQITGPNASDNTVQHNRIGTNAAGTAAIPNASDGVDLQDSADNVVASNVLSGNTGSGIDIEGGSGHTLTGNVIGLDATGTSALGNGIDGLFIGGGSTNNQIGGTAAGDGNTISANGLIGIEIEGGSTSGNVVQGNRIGTNAAGTAALGNSEDGVLIEDAPGTTIGGADEAAGNLISGNGDDGIDIFGSDASGTLIQHNRIGVDEAGTGALGNLEDGIDLNGNAADTVVRDNVVSANAEFGVIIQDGATGSVLERNVIGTDAAGTAALGNADDGVLIDGASDNTIGGATAALGNLISGNGDDGVDIRGVSSTGNLVQGNRIGTDATGTAALANTKNGVLILFAPDNTIGGPSAAAGNLISGNGDDGIKVFGGDAIGTLIQHNRIGVDEAGTGALGNLEDGIDLDDNAADTVVRDNVVSANAEIGVRIASGATNNVVSRNFIGTNASGDDLGNGGHGVLAQNSGPQVIGGTYDGSGTCCEGNTIAFNGGNGVTILALSSVSFDKGILGNRTFQNAGLGIDLQDDGITLNDLGDGDGESSANKLQNYPAFFTTDYDASANEVAVTYAVDSDPALTTAGASTYPLRIEFFRADADGEEGAAFLGTDAYTEADYDGCVSSGGTAPCPKAITFTPAASVTAADFILATATDATGNTSEFSESGQPLPVELTAFAATLDVGAVRLDWTTATETDNAGFEIERTIGEGWQSLAFVEGAGTTSQPQSYRFVDAELPFEAEALVYRLKQVDLDGASEYSPEVEIALAGPEAFALEPNFPNPFAGQTTLRYALPQAGPVRLTIYDVLGREVAVLVDEAQNAGRYEHTFTARGLASGVYFVRLQAGTQTQTRRMAMMR